MRLQLHAGFAFPDVERIAPYVASLGVSHLYLSPVTTARAGSMHGYDVTDPTRVNPELGGEEAFRRLVARLRSLRLGVILDIVPNHMAACEENPWWWDVLKKGWGSRFAKHFDIDWEPEDPELRGKLLLPVLGKSLDEALSGAELRLVEESGEYLIRYCDRRFPISPDDRSEIAAASPSDFDSTTKGGRQRLTHLLSRQNYKLAWWRVAADEINWRRFFDVNELVALRMEDEDVFESVHSLIFRLYEEGLIDGVRVDHVDGLADPGHYCRTLRSRLQALHGRRPSTAPADPPLIFVEKILLKGESLPGSWEMDGTSGYDFMDQVSLLQHDNDAATALAEAWSAISERPADFAAEEQAARRQLLARSFSGQLDACARSFHRLARTRYPRLDISRAALRRILAELLAHFPIYRSYGPAEDAREHDRPFLADAFAKARQTVLSSDRDILELLQSWLSEPLEGDVGRIQRFAVTRFQQLSAPVAAKAVEDTAAYRYGRLISRNDVGFDMGRLGFDAEDFHYRMAARRQRFPHALLATATHDHKRGEDVRARLAVLSEIPAEWTRALRGWVERSRKLRQRVSGSLAPNDGELAILFQTLVGSWPLDLASDEQGLHAYAERIAAWQLKALREEKLSTDWIVPNEAYEDAARSFVMRLLTERRDPDFLDDVAGFVRTIAPTGAVNGLVQTLLKLTAPGTPDLYQSTELWDFSLVDPDNRRPVDFVARQRSLGAAPLETLAETWRTGQVKQALIARILDLRREAPRLFVEGDYRPIRVAGARAKHLVAFSRNLGPGHLLVVVPRLVHSLLAGRDSTTFGPGAWLDTWVETEIPEGSNLTDILTGETIGMPEGRLRADRLFKKLPVAVLASGE